MGAVCALTGLPASNFNEGLDTYSYTIDFGGEKLPITLCKNCFSQKKSGIYSGEPSNDLKRVLIGLIANEKFKPTDYRIIHWEGNDVEIHGEIKLANFINQAIYPKTTQARRQRLLLYLHSLQGYDCQDILLRKSNIEVWGKCYYLNFQECNATLKHFEELGFIKFGKPDTTFKRDRIQFTHKGLDEIERLTREGSESNFGFVAMAFNEKSMPIRASIKNAIEGAGYSPLIVDEVHNESDKTIPDKIFASIRQARFCVADFSGHRNGVYFEAGFAVGLGIPVIYTCEKKEFEGAHFDIKQLQQIIYETPEELQEKLQAKIEAWIE